MVPGAGTGQLGRAEALLFQEWWTCDELLAGWECWGALVLWLGGPGSKTLVWGMQGGSVERTRWLTSASASVKDGLVFGGRGDRAGGRGEPCSTRGHCGLAARP